MSSYLSYLARLLLGGLSLASLAAFASRWHWVLDLFHHFVVFYVAASVLALILLLATDRRRKAWVVLALALILGHGWRLMPAFFPSAAPAPLPPEAENQGSRRLQVVFANVLAGRADPRLLDFLEREDPDLFALAEVGPPFKPVLERLRRRWPYAFQRLRTDNYGLAVFSRWPMDEVEDLRIDGLVPSFAFQWRLPEQTVQVIASHPPPPMSSSHAARRNLHLEAFAKLGRQHNPSLLLGDLNVTPWSPHFRDLLAEGGWRQARNGFGLTPTWSPRRFPWPLLPIDHVLYRGPWKVLDFRVGPKNRSDHRPIQAFFELSIPEPGQ
ncbi:MAG: hypothetical protein DWQ01_13470 [Planctomycetota bacterium]|nr:MAG: hypothetical protein DWQ01_13470 [Planctomycetota bacterium]